jgi:hypothetical protein
VVFYDVGGLTAKIRFGYVLDTFGYGLDTFGYGLDMFGYGLDMRPKALKEAETLFFGYLKIDLAVT